MMRLFNVSEVVLALMAAGCTGSPADAETPESELLGADESAIAPGRGERDGASSDLGGHQGTPNAPPIAGLGEGCGGMPLGPIPVCAKGLFCNYRSEDICGFADAAGTCAEKPGACLDHHAPVCGCDGQSYGNACMAAMSGVSVKHGGRCASSPPNNR